jgi:hypothetical protein
MLRRRQRSGGGSLLWGPLVFTGLLVVLAGAARQVYHLHPDGVTTYGVVVLGLAAIALYTYSRIRRWWR